MRLQVDIQLDPMPGALHTPEQMQKSVQRILGDLLGHYRPEVMVLEDAGVSTTVTRSAGRDEAVVVFIDTDTEPDGSDGGPGLRVWINDHNVYSGTPFEAA